MARLEKTRTAMPMHNPRAGTGDDAGAAVDEDARPCREQDEEPEDDHPGVAEDANVSGTKCVPTRSRDPGDDPLRALSGLWPGPGTGCGGDRQRP
jgi:hypothetical protein